MLFTPDAEFVHVGGADDEEELGPDVPRAGARPHPLPGQAPRAARGRAGAAPAARLAAAARLVFSGERGRTYADTARWLAGSSVEELLAE